MDKYKLQTILNVNIKDNVDVNKKNYVKNN